MPPLSDVGPLEPLVQRGQVTPREGPERHAVDDEGHGAASAFRAVYRPVFTPADAACVFSHE